MEDSNGTIHVRKIQLGPTGKPTEVPFLETKPGGELQLENKMKVNLFEIFLHWHRKEEDPVGIDPSGGLDLLWFLFQLNRRDSNSLPEGNSLDLRLEQSNPASRYSLFAQDLFKEAQTKKKRFSIDEVKTYVPLRKCEPPATLKVVPKTSDQQYMERIFQPLINSDVELLSSQEFVTYFSSLPVTEGIIYLLICDGEDTEEEVPMGEELIDPDGYVYDAGLGIEALIQGAMVTCDMYDEDYQTWSRWPAELYESQINPQVTGADGYYAVFVPPGLYRVRAVAYGYDDHASPDIRVINEVVHYNIPMTGPGIWGIFLPFVIR